jgi:DnaK suppressor protein
MDTTAVRNTLQTELDLLMARAGRIDDHQHERDREVPKDSSELAVHRQGDEVVEALDSRTRVEIRQIQDALHRLDEGTYGTCVRCGSQINERRLQAVPWTPICVRCAEAVEAGA